MLQPFATDEEIDARPGTLPERVRRFVKADSQRRDWMQSAFGAGMPLIALVGGAVSDLDYVWHTAAEFSGMNKPPKHAVMLRTTSASANTGRPPTLSEHGIGLLNLSTRPQTLVKQPAHVVHPLLRHPFPEGVSISRMIGDLWNMLPTPSNPLFPSLMRVAKEGGFIVSAIDDSIPLKDDWSEGHPVFDALMQWGSDRLGVDAFPMVAMQPVSDLDAAIFAATARFEA
jgi:hypothetical protein